MKLVSNITLKVILLFCFFNINSFESFSQETEKEIVQINLEGSNLEILTIQIDGNNVLINGQKPEDLGINLNISRKKAGKEGISTSEYGHVSNSRSNTNHARPFLGIVTQEVDNGVQIIELNAEGPAKRAGMRLGDKIVNIDDQKINSHTQLVDLISGKYAGDKIYIDFMRGDKPYKIEIVLGVKSTPIKNNRKILREDVDASAGPMSLGIKMRESADGKYWKVVEANENSAGYEAGIRVNDTILEMNGIKIESASDVEKVMKYASKDQGIKVKIRRVKEIINLEIK